MPRVAIVLAGCGRLDGSEIHESTLALLCLARGGARYQCLAPDAPQALVCNHLTGQPETPARNQLAEAARIARGDILPLAEARAADYDALVIPGGNGAFRNLSQGAGQVQPDLRRLLNEMADARKPIAAICIAPVLAARVLGPRGIQVTIGNDPETIAAIESTGARHRLCTVDACVADPVHRIVSTPAYMLGPGIADIAPGIEACIRQLLDWCARPPQEGPP